MRRLKTVRRPPIYPNEPSHLPCSSLTHPAAVLTPSIGVLRWIRVKVSRLPRKPQAAFEHLPHLLMQYQTRPKQLKRTLGERPVFHFDTQRHLPSYVEVRPLLGLGVAHPVMCLKHVKRLDRKVEKTPMPPKSSIGLVLAASGRTWHGDARGSTGSIDHSSQTS